MSQETSVNTGPSLPDLVSLRKSAKILPKIPNGDRIAAANSLAGTIDNAIHGDDSDWRRLFEFAPIALSSSTLSSIVGSLSTNLKVKLHNFNVKTVHAAPSIHEHLVNVSKPVDLRKVEYNKHLVGYVYAARRLIASDDSVIKPSPEAVETLCLKHPVAPADIRHVLTLDMPYERYFSDTDIVEALTTFRPSSAGGVDSLRPGHL